MTNTNQRVALITGSGRERVGNVVAHHLAKRGYSIALHYHSSASEALETRDELRSHKVRCEAYQADVAKEEDITAMFQQHQSDFGRLDLLVTTASIWYETAFDAIDRDELIKNFEINTLGTFYAARAAGKMTADQPEGGSIITIGDWAIERPYRDYAAYFISKGSLPTLTRVLAHELSHLNPKIRVNCLHPGPIMFPPDAAEERNQKLTEATLVKHADCTEMLAQCVEMLAENTFITGACIPIDGGRHMFSPGEA